MLCLNEDAILKAVTHEEIIEVVEYAMCLYESDSFHMPDRTHVDYGGNTLLLMPCFMKEKFGTKLVSVFPGNPGKLVPVVIGTMILNDGRTGQPLALLNGSVLTALRTGAVGAVGIRHTTPEHIKNLGIIGAGVQGFNLALFTTYVRELSDIFVFDTDEQKALSFIQKLSGLRPGVKIHKTGTVDELLEKSEAVITATTSKQPVLPDREESLKGKHFIGVGSFRPNQREFPGSLFKSVKRVFIDSLHAVEESGDLITPLTNGWIQKEQVSTLGRWIVAKKVLDENETTLFKSVGMALFDLIVSDLVYQNALKRGLGSEINL